MDIAKVKQRISDLADGEWFIYNNEKYFLTCYERLTEKGFTGEEAIEFLEDMYYTVSSEYGN